MSNLLPSNPSIERLKKEAHSLHLKCRAGDVAAIQRVRQCLTLFRFQPDSEIATSIKLSHAQDVIAREFGFTNWPALNAFVTMERTSHRAMNGAMTNPRMKDLAFRSGLVQNLAESAQPLCLKVRSCSG